MILTVLLILLCVQGLVKFTVGFLVLYSTRIRQVASYYERGGRVITLYDNIILAVMVVLVGLLLVTGVHPHSFVTGLVVGMLVIQVFFHRFSQPLPEDRAPEAPVQPRKLMSYAIQADPGLAWREIAFMALLFIGSLLALVSTW
ncbi:hypothetical protein NLX83_15520 [Allokutzneria sp. A3M-2-11 16]|uniref:hypothetical protein n=1 Tax=Allokutzneria sp. A3M-2-11 16 TaxID=2962043 RepID=UPI0020B8D67A|nr:hypothetical protein [Allokutzneria sp. A3M-2-11 16]MCP3800676.1 hypothetical protein [Allokutzneria sp. A3M-2-11 16]